MPNLVNAISDLACGLDPIPIRSSLFDCAYAPLDRALSRYVVAQLAELIRWLSVELNDLGSEPELSHAFPEGPQTPIDIRGDATLAVRPRDKARSNAVGRALGSIQGLPSDPRFLCPV